MESIELIAAGAVVVDVRQASEWRRAHIPGAVHIPLAELSARSVELPEGRVLIAFCTGGLRSAAAANLLSELGFDARNMVLGLIDWRGAGGDLESALTRG